MTVQKLGDKHFCLKKTDFASSWVKRFTDVFDNGEKMSSQEKHALPSLILKNVRRELLLKALWKPFSKSTPNYTFNFRVSCLPAWCQCAKVPKGCQLLIFTCQCSNKCANVRKACHLLNLVYQSAKGVPNFQLCMSTCQKGNWFFNYFSKEFFNFSVMLTFAIEMSRRKM